MTRRYWGVMFVSPGGTRGPLGNLWADGLSVARYPGEPGRTLLFIRRAAARAWCRSKMATYTKYPDGHICREWRFRPVQVCERVTVIRTTRGRGADSGA